MMHRARTYTSLAAGLVVLFSLGQARADDAGKTAPPPKENKAGAPPAKPAIPDRATVLHVPYGAAESDAPLTLVAVVDDAWTESSLVVRYRQLSTPGGFHEVPFRKSSAGGYFATIPAEAVRRPGVAYYIAGRTLAGAEHLHFASASAPQIVRVEQSPTARWESNERRRLGGYVSTVAVQLNGQNFGNRYPENKDYYLRGEIDWTHRLVRPNLYAVSLGYGFIDGKTPESSESTTQVLDRGARYGYAGVHLRLHESVSLRTRAFLGVSTDEFIVGARAVLTLGKFYQSSVDLGAEYLEDLGPSVWIRLQWDTVYPFIMGATIVKTDIPEASLSGGQFIRWDVAYPITPRISVRANLSFGSRDGPGNFGGGIGSELAF